jgi:hypothetical protein
MKTGLINLLAALTLIGCYDMDGADTPPMNGSAGSPTLANTPVGMTTNEANPANPQGGTGSTEGVPTFCVEYNAACHVASAGGYGTTMDPPATGGTKPADPPASETGGKQGTTIDVTGGMGTTIDVGSGGTGSTIDVTGGMGTTIDAMGGKGTTIDVTGGTGNTMDATGGVGGSRDVPTGGSGGDCGDNNYKLYITDDVGVTAVSCYVPGTNQQFTTDCGGCCYFPEPLWSCIDDTGHPRPTAEVHCQILTNDASHSVLPEADASGNCSLYAENTYYYDVQGNHISLEYGKYWTLRYNPDIQQCEYILLAHAP